MCRAGFVIEDLVEPLHAKADAAGRRLRPPQPVRCAVRADQGPADGRGEGAVDAVQV